MNNRTSKRECLRQGSRCVRTHCQSIGVSILEVSKIPNYKILQTTNYKFYRVPIDERTVRTRRLMLRTTPQGLEKDRKHLGRNERRDKLCTKRRERTSKSSFSTPSSDNRVSCLWQCQKDCNVIQGECQQWRNSKFAHGQEQDEINVLTKGRRSVQKKIKNFCSFPKENLTYHKQTQRIRRNQPRTEEQ